MIAKLMGNGDEMSVRMGDNITEELHLRRNQVLRFATHSNGRDKRTPFIVNIYSQDITNTAPLTSTLDHDIVAFHTPAITTSKSISHLHQGKP